MYGYLGPNGCRQDDHDPAAARAAPPERRPRASCSASTPGATRCARTARVAYVAGEPFLWPALTGAETLRVPRAPARRHRRRLPRQLVERFQLDARKKIRALSKGNRQKVAADRRARHAARPAAARRAHQRPRPADGGGLPRLRRGGQGARADRVPLLAHPQRGRGAVRPRRDPARGPARRSRARSTSCATSARRRSRSRSQAARPQLPPLAGVSVESAGPNALRFEVSGGIGPLIAALAGHPVDDAHEPRALARGDLPAPLRQLRDRGRASAALRSLRRGARARAAIARACARQPSVRDARVRTLAFAYLFALRVYPARRLPPRLPDARGAPRVRPQLRRQQGAAPVLRRALRPAHSRRLHRLARRRHARDLRRRVRRCSPPCGR